jgi:hypothetical protein
MLFLVLFILIIWKLYSNVYEWYGGHNNILYNKILLSNAISQVNTGDIILFRHNTTPALSTLYGHPTFGHVGIILKSYTALSHEITMDDYITKENYPKTHTGQFTIPLTDRINNYCGNVYICKLKKELTECQINSIKEFISQKKEYFNLFNLLAEQIGFNSNKTYCSKYVFDILRNSNIFDYKGDRTKNIEYLWIKGPYSNPTQIINDNEIVETLGVKNLSYE